MVLLFVSSGIEKGPYSDPSCRENPNGFRSGALVASLGILASGLDRGCNLNLRLMTISTTAPSTLNAEAMDRRRVPPALSCRASTLVQDLRF